MGFVELIKTQQEFAVLEELRRDGELFELANVFAVKRGSDELAVDAQTSFPEGSLLLRRGLLTPRG